MQGEEGNAFFLLEAGEAFATKVLEPGKPAQKVMDYTKGMYFGELALIRNTPRAANVLAKVSPDVPETIDKLRVPDVGQTQLQAAAGTAR